MTINELCNKLESIEHCRRLLIGDKNIMEIQATPRHELMIKHLLLSPHYAEALPDISMRILYDIPADEIRILYKNGDIRTWKCVIK